MRGDKPRRGTSRGAAPCLSPGRMFKAVADRRADLHPGKSACVGGQKESRKKRPGEGGERREPERGHTTASMGFLFLNTTAPSSNRRRVIQTVSSEKSSVGPQSPSMHLQLGSQASGPAGLPLCSPLPDLQTHLSAASQSHGPAPRAGPVPRRRSGGLGTGPCFSLSPSTSRPHGEAAVSSARLPLSPGYSRAATGKPRPTRPLLPGAGQLLITAARSALPGTTASVGPDRRACAMWLRTPFPVGESACPPVRRRRWARRGGMGRRLSPIAL